MASIGILGGTFNPPHLGHLALARDAREELGLDRVLLMPAGIAPHKPGAAEPGAEHRLAMCRLALQGEPALSVSALEVERDGPSYTVDTLRAIHASDPHLQLTFIAGADVACTLPSWREPAKLLELAGLAVAARAGADRRTVLRELAPLLAGVEGARTSGEPSNVRFLRMPVIDISSSIVRERAARGEPVEDLVGEPVGRYIAEQGLYRARAGVGG